MKNRTGRPPIDDIGTSAELRRWYWRKDELVARARSLGLKTTSGKFVILDRIAHFLDTGEKQYPGDQSVKPRSRFDWQSAKLTDETVVTDNYKNTKNVRNFFSERLGGSFKFNTEFMDWMKANTGKTLADACQAYQEMKERQAKPGFRSKIADHNQFNQYTRDFLDDNPDLGMTDVRKFWALKISQASETGRHVYDPADLTLDPEHQV